MTPPRSLRFTLPLLAVVSHLGLAAAPRLPASDAEIVERLPGRASDPAQRELDTLRAAWRRDPRDAAAAVALARAYVERTGATGDPRYTGYAQAALQPWWDEAAPPIEVRVQRAVLRQFGHGFDAALADLAAVVQAAPDHAEAWSWIAAIELVRADYPAARRACQAMAPQVPALIARGCSATVDSLSGRADGAAAALRQALAAAPGADPAQRLWVLTRLAEIEERRGDFAAAETAFGQALALGVEDVYLLAAWSDFLLDRGRPAEVLTLLRERARADVLLLRLALAAKAVGDPQAKRWADELAARFEAARARGDTTHRKEESRFELALRGDTERALALAQQNYAEQREAADARLLLEAALAAGRPEAAAPVLAWMQASGVESVVLQSLAARLKGGR